MKDFSESSFALPGIAFIFITVIKKKNCTKPVFSKLLFHWFSDCRKNGVFFFFSPLLVGLEAVNLA